MLQWPAARAGTRANSPGASQWDGPETSPDVRSTTASVRVPRVSLLKVAVPRAEPTVDFGGGNAASRRIEGRTGDAGNGGGERRQLPSKERRELPVDAVAPLLGGAHLRVVCRDVVRGTLRLRGLYLDFSEKRRVGAEDKVGDPIAFSSCRCTRRRADLWPGEATAAR